MKKRSIFAGLLICLGCTICQAGVIVIGNKASTDPVLTAQQVKQIFLGKRVKWADGSRIRFVALKDSPTHQSFLRQYLQKDNSQWTVYWKRMIFTGRGMPPRQFDSQQKLIEYVSETRGAVGYIDESQMDPSQNIQVIALR